MTYNEQTNEINCQVTNQHPNFGDGLSDEEFIKQLGWNLNKNDEIIF